MSSDTQLPAKKREPTEGEKKLTSIKAWLTAAKSQIGLALPKHMTAERMVRIAVSACSRNPKLLMCTPESIVLSLINASETGLEPNGQHAHLIPYYNFNKALGRKVYEAQFQADYKGLVQLAYRSGIVQTFDARVVYAKDRFAYQYGTDPKIEHIPSEEPDPGPITHAYAVAIMPGGGRRFVVMSINEIYREHRAHSRGAFDKNNKLDPESVWSTHEAAMCRKTVARELYKWIPSSPEMQRVAALDQEAELGHRQLPENIDLAALGMEQLSIETVEDEPSGAEKITGQLEEKTKLQGETERMRAEYAAAKTPSEVSAVYDKQAGPDGWLMTEADRTRSRETAEVRKAELSGELFRKRESASGAGH